MTTQVQKPGNAELLYNLADEKTLFTGSLRQEELALLDSHPRFQELVSAVIELEDFAELVTRAMHNPDVGLVVEIKATEPSYDSNLRNAGVSTQHQVHGRA